MTLTVRVGEATKRQQDKGLSEQAEGPTHPEPLPHMPPPFCWEAPPPVIQIWGSLSGLAPSLGKEVVIAVVAWGCRT